MFNLAMCGLKTSSNPLLNIDKASNLEILTLRVAESGLVHPETNNQVTLELSIPVWARLNPNWPCAASKLGLTHS